MGAIQIKSIQDTAPLVDIEQTPPCKNFSIVRNIADDKFYVSNGIEWKLVPELNIH